MPVMWYTLYIKVKTPFVRALPHQIKRQATGFATCLLDSVCLVVRHEDSNPLFRYAQLHEPTYYPRLALK